MVSVQGSNILVDGQAPSNDFFGVVDTTALQYAILAYIEGQTQYAGKSSVFNGPDTGSYSAVSPSDTAAHFFDRYFALLAYYHCNTVRIGAGDTWGTSIQYDAWANHHDAFISLLKTMEAAAEAHNIWIVLVLAGTQDYPAYQFGGSGSVFSASSSAYQAYVRYCNNVMAALDGLKGIAIFDLFNEPDHDYCWAKYWSGNGGKTAFHTWACSVAEDTADASSHPRTMGVAGLGLMFGWGKSDFDLCTGTVPFEIASRHYYASNTDVSNFATPEQWAQADGKPLYWGELGNNKAYPLVRYSYGEQAIFSNGGQIITSMVLTGTAGYPYTGSAGPSASFTVTPTLGNGSTAFSVDASACSDSQDVSSKLQVRWDWNNDGTYDTAWTTAKVASHSYSQSGSYVIGMQVMNSAGSTASMSKAVTVDADGPQVAIVSPTSGSSIKSTSVDVRWSGADSGSGIAAYLVRTEGGQWTMVSSSSTNLTIGSLSQGGHVVTVRAVDNAGNYKDATATFTTSIIATDYTPPSLTITSPVTGSTITVDHPTISWTASDASGIAYFQIVRDGGSWVQLSSGQTSYTTVNSLASGSHTVTVRAMDNAGNYKDATVVFSVSTASADTTAPSLTIVSPSNGATTTATHPTISWTASDASGIAYFQIVRDGGSWVQLSSSQTSYTTVNALGVGSHTVTVKAVDNAGNAMTKTVTFTVK
ncbi:MAG: Ig-like domain-containing protein [Methanomassiliicoccus sp.]|nr:Ig-like domain-containing protein [Methanomassiliicoccus sp.]